MTDLIQSTDSEVLESIVSTYFNYTPKTDSVHLLDDFFSLSPNEKIISAVLLGEYLCEKGYRTGRGFSAKTIGDVVGGFNDSKGFEGNFYSNLRSLEQNGELVRRDKEYFVAANVREFWIENLT